MNEVIFYGFCGLVLYLWIFDTDRFNKINKAGYDNIEKTGKLFGQGAKAGWTIFKMFKR